MLLTKKVMCDLNRYISKISQVTKVTIIQQRLRKKTFLINSRLSWYNNQIANLTMIYSHITTEAAYFLIPNKKQFDMTTSNFFLSILTKINHFKLAKYLPKQKTLRFIITN